MKCINTPVEVKNLLLTVFVLNTASYRNLLLDFFVRVYVVCFGIVCCKVRLHYKQKVFLVNSANVEAA